VYKKPNGCGANEALAPGADQQQQQQLPWLQKIKMKNYNICVRVGENLFVFYCLSVFRNLLCCLGSFAFL
jgi:hypothetical protein